MLVKDKIARYFLVLCATFYVLVFVGFFAFDGRIGRTVEIAMCVTNITAPLRPCSADCCQTKENLDLASVKETNYRKYLDTALELLKEDSNSKSHCKILANENILLRAVNYAANLNDSSAKKTDLPLPQDKTPNVTEKNKTSYELKDCQPIGYSKTKLPVTALASFPGSGNTWVRHLLQQATGQYHCCFCICCPAPTFNGLDRMSISKRIPPTGPQCATFCLCWHKGPPSSVQKMTGELFHYRRGEGFFSKETWVGEKCWKQEGCRTKLIPRFLIYVLLASSNGPLN